MDIDHGFFTFLSKSFGLFYLIAFSFGVVVYALWPRNRASFDKAARDILDTEDAPWR